jgi:hypothetical protein
MFVTYWIAFWPRLISSSANGGGKATLKFWASINCGKANSLRGGGEVSHLDERQII